jgi:hypothetical protein
MNKPVYIFALLFLTLDMAGQSIKPDVIASSGGINTNSEVIASWTIGEVFIHEFSNSSLRINQGFHQGDLSMASGLENLPQGIDIMAYPNPVEKILFIDLSEFPATEKWNLEVFTPEGKLIQSTEVKSGLCEIDLSSFTPGNYLVRVKNMHDHYKTFNIIKQ